MHIFNWPKKKKKKPSWYLSKSLEGTQQEDFLFQTVTRDKEVSESEHHLLSRDDS